MGIAVEHYLRSLDSPMPIHRVASSRMVTSPLVSTRISPSQVGTSSASCGLARMEVPRGSTCNS